MGTGAHRSFAGSTAPAKREEYIRARRAWGAAPPVGGTFVLPAADGPPCAVRARDPGPPGEVCGEMAAPRPGPAEPRPLPRSAAACLGLLALGAAALPAAATARMTILDDDAATIRGLTANGPDGSPGLRVAADGLYQTPTVPGVLPATRRLARVSGAALTGRGAAGMADLLADRTTATRSRRVLVDDLDTGFRGREGDDLAAALAILSRRGLARGVHFSVPDAASLLTDPAMGGARAATYRAGGVWMDTGRWSSAGWLTWPSEMAYRLATSGSARARAHVSIGTGDQAALWGRARAGSACPVLANGPGGARLGASASAFGVQYRWTFPLEQGSKAPAAGCTAVPTLTAAGAQALNAAALDEDTGLEIPAGGLVTPPLAVGVPAQVTLQLGPDPLGLAAALGVTSEQFWAAAGASVTARGAGVDLSDRVSGDGSVTLAFTPTVPGGIALRLFLPGLVIPRSLGGPTDVVGPLRAVRADAGLITRIVAGPDTWALDMPLMNPGQAPGSPVIEVIAPPAG